MVVFLPRVSTEGSSAPIPPTKPNTQFLPFPIALLSPRQREGIAIAIARRTPRSTRDRNSVRSGIKAQAIAAAHTTAMKRMHCGLLGGLI
jgi:hypothetical protein